MKWRIADFIVIGVVLAAAAAIWLYPLHTAPGGAVTLEADGAAQTLSLAEDQTLTLPHATVTIAGGRCAITQADCPDQVCVKTGWISRGGQSIVCVPNRIVITVSGGAAVDAVTQ